MEIDNDQVIKRIKDDLMCAEKALVNAQINVVRLERELQEWEAKKRTEQDTTYYVSDVSSGPVNLKHIGRSP